MKKILPLILSALIPTLIVALVLASTLAWQQTKVFANETSNDLPTNFLDDITKTTTITDREGNVLYYVYKDQNRLFVSGDKIAQVMKDAIIAAEDERFYLHNGLDLVSIARAVEANYKSKGIVSGGSTLTMQLVKNITGDSQTSIQRKVKEAYLATLIEQRFSKAEILTTYLNIVSLGHNLGGVETASRFYFDKSAKDLTLPEAATLAALPTSPEFYATNPDALHRRRNYVLDRMVATGKVSQEEAEAAKATSTPIKEPTIPLKAPHFVMTAIDQLKAEHGEALYTKGLTVVTSLDPKTQTIAEQTVAKNAGVLRNVGAQNVGLVSLDPKTGQVLAMVGSVNYDNKANRGEVNFTTANLSYGSTLKPIITAFLFEKEHMSPGGITWDVKTDFDIGEAKPYTPQNYDRSFFGPMTWRQALGNSRNIPMIKALIMVGLEDTLKRLVEMGVTSLGTDASRYGPSLAVGGGGIPLIQLTGAYTALANEGKVNPAQLILKTVDYTGKTVKEYQPLNKPVLKPEVAYEVAEILQDNKARERVFGSRSPLVINGKTVAAKTGTAEDYRSALTVGFTPDIVTGVIVANNNNEPLRAGGSGAMAAAPFWNDFMTEYLKDKPNNWFARPQTVVETEFPTVIGRIKDLTAPWQSPSDRFNRRVAEADFASWNRAVAGFSTRRRTEDRERSQNTAQAETRNDNNRDNNRDRGNSGRDRD